METVIQELIKHFTDAWSSPGDLWNPAKVIEKIESMEEKEKQQLIDFYNEGYRDAESEMGIEDKDISEFSNAIEYYNETYGKGS